MLTMICMALSVEELKVFNAEIAIERQHCYGLLIHVCQARGDGEPYAWMKTVNCSMRSIRIVQKLQKML